ncbi:helix-turn-helix domain-containing protein [Gordonia asplenii]
MSVNSVEHFAVPLRQFSCYGHPIFHPTTRRIEGVLDLSVLADTTNPLLPALVAGAVADIEQRLLDGGRASDRELLAAFQRQSGRRRAVVAIGHDLLMSNQAAMAMLGTADFALLKIIAGDVRDDSSITITLESGVEATVRAARVGGTRTGALLEIEGLHKRSVGGRPALPRSQEPILISGPPGSGRSTQVRQIARTRPLAVLSAASALLDGPAAWVRDFDAAVGTGQGLVCVDGVDLLDDDVLAVVMNRLGDGSRIAQLILVSGPVENLTGRAAALAGLCTERVELLPLANRVSELPRVVSTMIRAVGGPATLHLTPGALQTLAAQPWPGNLRELRTVVEYVVGRRSDGAITVDDLPEAYRSSGPARQMAPIERAERSAIIAALRENDGNKVRTAESLGISRTTLYAKMRSLRISTY